MDTPQPAVAETAARCRSAVLLRCTLMYCWENDVLRARLRILVAKLVCRIWERSAVLPAGRGELSAPDLCVRMSAGRGGEAAGRCCTGLLARRLSHGLRSTGTPRWQWHVTDVWALISSIHWSNNGVIFCEHLFNTAEMIKANTM